MKRFLLKLMTGIKKRASGSSSRQNGRTWLRVETLEARLALSTTSVPLAAPAALEAALEAARVRVLASTPAVQQQLTGPNSRGLVDPNFRMAVEPTDRTGGGGHIVSPAEIRGFNPQPEPPG
jgi:hypothetical protein